MPRNGLLKCRTCQKPIRQGFAYLNHAKVCHVFRSYMEEHAAMDAVVAMDEDVVVAMDGGDMDMDAVGDMVAEPCSGTIAEHLERLSSASTLDTKQLLRYAEWGELELSPTDEEVLRFLRSVEIGGGASDAASRASLDYAHSLGGRGLLLPKTVRTCWNKVKQVRC
jgi:hypothetical protein